MGIELPFIYSKDLVCEKEYLNWKMKLASEKN